MNILAQPDFRPECPQCGCLDVRAGAEESLGDDTITSYTCEHCGNVFQDYSVDGVGVEAETIYQTTRCPYCKSSDTIVTTGPRGPEKKRRHQCRKCLQPFGSKQLRE